MHPADLVEFDDVGMIEQFQYLNLAIDFAQIIVVQSRLVDDLDGHLHARTHTYTHTRVRGSAEYVITTTQRRTGDKSNPSR